LPRIEGYPSFICGYLGKITFFPFNVLFVPFWKSKTNPNHEPVKLLSTKLILVFQEKHAENVRMNRQSSTEEAMVEPMETS
jgi:hypothetical protein